MDLPHGYSWFLFVSSIEFGDMKGTIVDQAKDSIYYYNVPITHFNTLYFPSVCPTYRLLWLFTVWT